MLRQYPFLKFYLFLFPAVLVTSISAVNVANAYGPPIAFDQYSVNAGVIIPLCEPAICTDRVSGNGMLQRRIDVSSGPAAGSYIQFILTEPGVTGSASAPPFSTARGSLNFTNEDFIKMYNRGSGISSKQTYVSSSFEMPGHNPDIEDRFVSSHTYNFGWAMNTQNPWVKMNQEISQVDYRADEFNPLKTFIVTAEITSAGPGFNSNYDVSLTQMVNLVGVDGVTIDGMEKFAYKRLSGSLQNTTGSVLLPNGSGTGEVSWLAGETISATWIGQHVGIDIDTLNFGTTRYQNQDQGTETKLTSQTDPSAVNWLNSPFGPVADILQNDYVTSPTDRTIQPPGPLLATVTSHFVAPDATTAGPPMSFDIWSVLDGDISAGCDLLADIVCEEPIVSEQGFLQRKIRVALPSIPEDPLFEDYYQTIITDAGVTGDPLAEKFQSGSLGFKYEAYTKANSGNGIAAQMKITERDLAYIDYSPDSNNSLRLLNSSSGELSLTSMIQTGWAHGGSLDPTVIIDQHVTHPDHNFLNVSSMDNLFHLEMGETQLDKILDMFYVVGTINSFYIDPVTGQLARTGFVDNIMFATSIRQGAFQNTTRLATDADLLPSIGAANADITWQPGDALQATWVGAKYISSDPAGATVHRTTAYTNLSVDGMRIKAVDDTVVTNLADPSPESWVAPFSLPPSLSGPPAYQSIYIPPLLP